MLVVEDDEQFVRRVAEELQRLPGPFALERVEDGEEMRAALLRCPCALVLTEWRTAKLGAPAVLAIAQELGWSGPVIVVSSEGDDQVIVEAMRAGATDFVRKPALVRLAEALERALREPYTARPSATVASLAAELARQRAELGGAQEALRQTEAQVQRLQRADTVGRLAGAVAHDFNNVLSVILSYAHAMASELDPDDPAREGLDEMRRAADRAVALTRQLVLFSRQRSLAPRLLDVSEVLLGFERLLQRVVGENVELTVSAPPLAGRIEADTGQLEQLVMNLALNARDAMPGGGKLTIEAADVDLDGAYAAAHPGVRAGPHVMIAVTDSGPGIPLELQSRIFQPFFTTREPEQASGLGLSTVAALLRQAGGSIVVDSGPGRGTSFRVYLPRRQSVPRSGAAERTAPEPAAGAVAATVLLVEDDDQVRSVARMILKRGGYRVLEARNAGEALLVCEKRSGPIDLMLSDVVMPHMSGPELADRIASSRPEMKVLCMSGYIDDTIGRHGIVEQSTPFLQKPFTPEVLLRRVREVLGTARSI